jgi:hypothetical protein
MRDAEDTVVAHYDEARDAFVTASGYEEDPEDVWGVVVREGTPLYSIGGMSWTWMEVPWEDTPRAFDLGDEVRA